MKLSHSLLKSSKKKKKKKKRSTDFAVLVGSD